MNDIPENQESLFNFPCEFPIKVMGNTSEEFEQAVFSIINKHVEDIMEGAIALNPSKKGNYTAITVTITATSRLQLDNIYRELTACEHVIMAL